MADEYQAPQTMMQAATSPNAAGALQQLLMSRLPTPEQEQWQRQGRQDQLEQYQNSLRADPYQGYSALDHGLYSWIGNMGKSQHPAYAAMQGIAAGGKFMGDRGQQMQKGEIAASKLGYEDALKDEKMGLEELKALTTMSRGVMGKQPSPEALRTVYTSARNEAAQIAKGYNFNGAEEQSRWIEQQANIAVQNYMNNFATQPSGPRGIEGVTAVPGTTVTAQVPAGGVENSTAHVQPVSSQTGSGVTPPVLRDKSEEARAKEFATGTEKSALKDYEENVQPAARAASSMMDTINMVRQIPRTQDAFAPYREKLGSAMNALGMDGSMVKEAQSLQQVRPLLAKIANDRLLMAKGVQTEGDAQRAYNEFVQITDTQQAADFMYTWAEELARRAKFKDQVYKLASKEKGTMREGSNYWDQTDYAKAAPVALLNGKAWAFSNWRDAFSKANPNATMQDVISTWNDLAGRK